MEEDYSIPYGEQIDVNESADELWIHCGLLCAIKKNPTITSYNGYVRIPNYYPDFGKDYSHEMNHIKCHGRLTFGHPSVSGEYYWYGFDTLHYTDYWPGLERLYPYTKKDYTINWTKDMVIEETSKLAETFYERWQNCLRRVI